MLAWGEMKGGGGGGGGTGDGYTYKGLARNAVGDNRWKAAGHWWAFHVIAGCVCDSVALVLLLPYTLG